MTRPRVLIADDHSIILAGLRKLVEEQCEVVGTVEDGRTLLVAAQRLCPDIILLDIAMPLLNGLDAARQLVKLVPQSKLIFLTMQSSPTYATEAFKAGASGYLLKRSAVTELPQAIQSVIKGQHYITPVMTKDVLQSVLKPSGSSQTTTKIARLTSRQREVLQLLAEGKGNKDIASLLNLSVRTVEFHRARIMDMLNIHSTAELTQYAIAEGLISL
jgi:DNA-binding NarL/FixJ family response regulator